MDPKLRDDPAKPKIFSLSGFSPISGISARNRKAEKDQIIQKIISLGGHYVESDAWDPSITHVISEVNNRTNGRAEKVMAAIAAGRWVLTKRYVEKSYKAKDWIEYPALFAYPGDAVIRMRRSWFLHGLGGGPFWNMRAALVMEDERKTQVYGRIIVAGGGTISDIQTIRELSEDQDQVTHVFLDTADVIMEFASVNNPAISFLHYYFIFQKLKSSSDVQEEDFNMMKPEVREMGITQRRRKRWESPGTMDTNRKKHKDDIIDIVTVDSAESDTESDDDIIEIVMLNGDAYDDDAIQVLGFNSRGEVED